ncbi:MAG TPA: ADP-ribosylglycohydrolase family protein [Anaerolineaceae bacterium]|nr:ADP-ribosylglycohydrolase family protein [Anaerolineaceae bacterium]
MIHERKRKAWEIDREIRLNAVPLDRRIHPGTWSETAASFPTGDDLIALFWKAEVPGSGAPEIPYVEMVESMANRGYDVSAAEALLPRGLELAAQQGAAGRDELRALTAELLAALHSAPRILSHPYWTFEHPGYWQVVQAAMDHPDDARDLRALDFLDERVLDGWLGQLAGGSFGTPLEGYHSQKIREVYGTIDQYVTPPETMNDDVVYELVFLDVLEQKGRGLTSRDLGLEWLRQIPFGWSAEWVALHNLSDGIIPPESGSFRNPYSDWIGAQMRGMVCGLVAPGWPLEAARLAYLDGQVSHAANGIFGEMFAAALTSLAFVHTDIQELIQDALRYLPQRSEYVAVARGCLDTIHSEKDPGKSWEILDRRFEEYNWIHAYPNLAADLLALCCGNGELTRSFQILAHAGLDVDCNAGLVGTVLGVMNGAPEKWSAPLNDRLETYLRGKETLSIRALAARTANLARGLVVKEKP